MLSLILSETSSATVTRINEIVRMLLMIMMNGRMTVITPWGKSQGRLINVKWTTSSYMSPGASWTLLVEVSWEIMNTDVLFTEFPLDNWDLYNFLIGQWPFLWTFYTRWGKQLMCLSPDVISVTIIRRVFLTNTNWNFYLYIWFY